MYIVYNARVKNTSDPAGQTNKQSVTRLKYIINIIKRHKYNIIFKSFVISISCIAY